MVVPKFNPNDKLQSKQIKNYKIGIIAQELEKLYPELVQLDPSGFREVDLLGLSSVLIQALKGLDLDIDVLYKYLELDRGEI